MDIIIRKNTRIVSFSAATHLGMSSKTKTAFFGQTAIFLINQGSKDIKNDILDCKYTNTKVQFHKYSARNT